MYVALSRCTTLEGIVLKQPLKKIISLMDWQVVKFLTDLQYAKQLSNCRGEDKLQMITVRYQGRTGFRDHLSEGKR